MKYPKANAAATYIRVQIPASVIVVSLLRLAIAIIKSIIITKDKIPRVMSQTAVDSIWRVCH